MVHNIEVVVISATANWSSNPKKLQLSISFYITKWTGNQIALCPGVLVAPKEVGGMFIAHRPTLLQKKLNNPFTFGIVVFIIWHQVEFLYNILWLAWLKVLILSQIYKILLFVGEELGFILIYNTDKWLQLSHRIGSPSFSLLFSPPPLMLWLVIQKAENLFYE